MKPSGILPHAISVLTAGLLPALALAGTPTPRPSAVGTSQLVPSPTPVPTMPTPAPQAIRVTPTQPTAATVALTGAQGFSAELTVASILGQCGDPGGFLPLTFLSAGPNSLRGGTIVLSNGIVRYSPPNPQFTGRDSFTYLIRNSASAPASGRIEVTVLPPAFPPTAVVLTQDGAGFTALFSGVPGLSYTIESADALSGPWTPLNPPGTVIAGLTGRFQFSDAATLPMRFYRARALP